MVKFCNKCKATKPLAEFHRSKRTYWQSVCKECQKMAVKRQQFSRYNLTVGEFNELLADQDAQCAICGGGPAAGKSRLSVDHDHETGRVRGLLCANCNFGLGNFKDDPVRLIRAAEYLTAHSAMTATTQCAAVAP